VDGSASVPPQKKGRVDKVRELLRMITFICFDLNPPSFGPLGGPKKGLDSNFSREVASLDVLPLDTQSGGRGEPTAKRSTTGSPPVCPKVRHRAF
jgi:hypothetical protein